MKILRTLCLAAAAAFVVASPANAALLSGQTVRLQYYFPDLSTPNNSSGTGNYLVGAGVEVTDGILSFDFTDTQIIFSFNNTGDQAIGFGEQPFNGYGISDLNGTIAPFTSVTSLFSNMPAEFTSSDVTFDANNIFLNFSHVFFDAHSSGSATFTINAPVPETDVPEPLTLSLFGAGLVGAFAAQRKRKARLA